MYCNDADAIKYHEYDNGALYFLYDLWEAKVNDDNNIKSKKIALWLLYKTSLN